MPPFYNGISFIGILNNGEEIAPFAQRLNFIGAAGVTRQAGADADIVDINVTAAANGPQATVLRRTGTLAMGAATTITWQAADLDQGGLFDLGGAPTLMTVPAALNGALMILSATLSGSGITAAARWGGRIIRAGDILAEAAMSATANNQIFLQTPPLVVSTGQTFDCRGTSSDAAWTLDNIVTTNFSALYWAA